jgi:hypothetical protein
MNLEQIMKWRTQELSARTRSEIPISVGSALLLAGVVAWRLEIVHEPRLELGLGAAFAWMAISLFAFRRRIFGRDTSLRDGVAVTCLEYYRLELERRRNHLRNVWLWHRPGLLACVILIGVLTGRANITFQPLGNALPLIVLLAAWVGFNFWRRRLQARSIQREIDELVQ